MPSISRAVILLSLWLWAGGAPHVQASALLDASQREELATWLGGDDPVLVVLVFPGLRADVLDQLRRDGTPLLPRLRTLSEDSITFEDTQTGAAHLSAGAFELLSGSDGLDYLTISSDAAPWPGGFAKLIGRGFHPIVGVDGLEADTLLRAAFPWLNASPPGNLETFLDELGSADDRPHLAVLFSDALLPPWQLPDAALDATDPEPWRDAPANASMAQLVERRRGTARTMAGRVRAGQAMSTRRHVEVFEWAARAAAVAADEVVARVLDTLDRAGLSSRSSVVVTSTTGTGVGDREVVGIASGVGRGQAAVPLIWRLPGGLLSGVRSGFPAQLKDLSSTCVELLGDRSLESGLNVFSAAPSERVRFSASWFEHVGEEASQLRLDTGQLVLLVSSDRETGLHDPRWDPREFEDLAGREPELVAAQRRGLSERLLGSAPELWILVKGHPDGLLEGVVRGEASVTAVGDLLEPMDSVRVEARRVSWSLVTDDVDRIRIPLSADFDDLVVEVRSPGESGRLHLGLAARALSQRSVRLSAFEPATLKARTGATIPVPAQWLSSRGPGVYLWIVSP